MSEQLIINLAYRLGLIGEDSQDHGSALDALTRKPSEIIQTAQEKIGLDMDSALALSRALSALQGMSGSRRLEGALRYFSGTASAVDRVRECLSPNPESFTHAIQLETWIRDLLERMRLASSAGAFRDLIDQPYEISFGRTKLKYGVDALSRFLNDKLEGLGSRLRVHVETMDASMRPAIILGEMESELKIVIGTNVTRLIKLRNTLVENDLTERAMGLSSDGLILVRADKLHLYGLGNLLRHRRINYRQEVMTHLERHFQEIRGSDEEALALLSEIIFSHELGHMTFRESYGSLLEPFNTFSRQELIDPFFTLINEFFADLQMLETILGENSDRKEKKLLMALLNAMHVDPQEPLTFQGEIFCFLVLSSVQVGDGEFKIDYDTLVQRVTSFKYLLHQIMSNLVHVFQLRSLGHSGHGQSPNQIRELYARELAALIQERESDPENGYNSNHRMLLEALIGNALMNKNEGNVPFKFLMLGNRWAFEIMIRNWFLANTTVTDLQFPLLSVDSSPIRKLVGRKLTAMPEFSTDVADSFRIPEVKSLLISWPSTGNGGSGYQEGSESPLQQSSEKLRTLLSQPGSPELLIETLRDVPALAGLWDTVVVSRENLTLAQHTSLVLRMFEQYFAGEALPFGLEPAWFRLVLALHDSGKAGAPDDERAFSKFHIRALMEQLAFDESKIRLAERLMDSSLGTFVTAVRSGFRLQQALATGETDRVRKYEQMVRTRMLLTKAEADHAWDGLMRGDADSLIEYVGGYVRHQIFEDFDDLKLDPVENFILREVYYVCDAGAYTTHANGGQVQIARENKSAFDDLFTFSPATVAMTQPMEDRVNAFSSALLKHSGAYRQMPEQGSTPKLTHASPQVLPSRQALGIGARHQALRAQAGRLRFAGISRFR